MYKNPLSPLGYVTIKEVMAKSASSQFKQARLRKNLTQHEVADKAGIHPNTYAKIERGLQEPSFASIKKICKVLDLNIDDIPA